MAGIGVLKGVKGTVTWAYYTAALVEGYTVRRSKSGAWSLVARVVQSDAYKMHQRPLIFVAPHAKPSCGCKARPTSTRDLTEQRCPTCRTLWVFGEWSWPIVSCSVTQGELRAELGPPNP